MHNSEASSIKRHHQTMPEILFFGSVFHAFSSGIQICGLFLLMQENGIMTYLQTLDTCCSFYFSLNKLQALRVKRDLQLVTLEISVKSVWAINCLGCITETLHGKCKKQIFTFTELIHNYRDRIANLTNGPHKIALCISIKLHVVSEIALCWRLLLISWSVVAKLC